MMTNTIALTYANDKEMDGAGAQLQRIYGIYAVSRFLGTLYIHTPVEKIGYHGLEALEKNAPTDGFESRFNQLLKMVSDVELPENAIIHEMDLVNAEVIKAKADGNNEFHLFRIFLPYPICDNNPSVYKCVSKLSPFTNKKNKLFRIAIHVRRGELFLIEQYRMLPNSYYTSTVLQIIKILSELSVEFVCELYTEAPSKKLTVAPGHYSINDKISQNTFLSPEMNSLDDFDVIPNLRKFVNGDPIEALEAMATADLLMMSRSSFSYVAAILNAEGIVIYHPFWHSPLPEWIVATENDISDATKLLNQILSAKARLARQTSI